MKKKLEKFLDVARKADRIVGGFGHDFNESLELLNSLQTIKFEFSRKGDTIARAYWEDIDFRGETIGGCVSVYDPL